MKNIYHEIRPALVATLVFAVICCGFYPLAVTAIARAAFREKADGSLVVDKTGTVIGSMLLGQNFSGGSYFHPRPSAAGATGYDAANSGGSNLGPTSRKLADAIRERIAAYRADNGLGETQPVPADAVTASGSGLDPHISVANATLQAARVARSRGLPAAQVRGLVAAHAEHPTAGLLGTPRVNVLMLNLALDHLTPANP